MSCRCSLRNRRRPDSASGCAVLASQKAGRGTLSMQTTSSGYLYPGTGGIQTQRRAAGGTDGPISYLPSVSQTPSCMRLYCSLKTHPLPPPASTQMAQHVHCRYRSCSHSRRGGESDTTAFDLAQISATNGVYLSQMHVIRGTLIIQVKEDWS